MKNILVTPTYAPDFKRCKDMLDSCDRYISGLAEHLILVDKPDLDLFMPLQRPNVRVICKSTLLPVAIARVPLQQRWWLTACSLPVRGWILQQIMKLAITAQNSADSVSFVDSDVLFVKPFDLNNLWENNSLRLFRDVRGPRQYSNIRYKNWYRFGCDALQIGRHDQQPSAFISQLASMRPMLVRQLFSRMEERFQRPWYKVLLNCLDFSEYTLYGLFAEHLGEAKSGHYFTESELCHSSWFYDIRSTEDVHSFIEKRSKDQCAIHLQSNLGLNAEALVNALAH